MVTYNNGKWLFITCETPRKKNYFNNFRQKQFFKDMNQLKRARAKMIIPSWKKLPERMNDAAKEVNAWLTENLGLFN